MGFSRQEYWSGLPFPSPEDLPDPGIELGSSALQLDSLPFELQGRSCSRFSSVAQSCPTLCHPMACSTPGFPVPHQLLELTQTHVHRFGDAIQPSHPLLSPSPPAFKLSQRQGLFQRVFSWGSRSIGASASASVLPMSIMDWFPLGWTGLISLQSKGLSRVFFNITVQKHQFFGAQLSL